ncbi:MAG: hypothetical protein E7476_03040 [Ruminococcaceae bacterium]|nr:hypothetical protein [Oscillospiraceae bacterium]
MVLHQIIRKKSQQGLQIAAAIFEGALSWVVFAGITICGFCLLKKYFCIPSPLIGPSGLQNFLADLLILVIGIEFIKTFLNRTPESIMEILLFAITRQVVLSHGSLMETLAGCAAVILLLSAHHFWETLQMRQSAAATVKMLDITSDGMQHTPLHE